MDKNSLTHAKSRKFALGWKPAVSQTGYEWRLRAVSDKCCARHKSTERAVCGLSPRVRAGIVPPAQADIQTNKRTRILSAVRKAAVSPLKTFGLYDQLSLTAHCCHLSNEFLSQHSIPELNIHGYSMKKAFDWWQNGQTDQASHAANEIEVPSASYATGLMLSKRSDDDDNISLCRLYRHCSSPQRIIMPMPMPIADIKMSLAAFFWVSSSTPYIASTAARTSLSCLRRACMKSSCSARRSGSGFAK